MSGPAQGSQARRPVPLVTRTLLDVPSRHCGPGWGPGMGRVSVVTRSRGRVLRSVEVYRQHAGQTVEVARALYDADIERIAPLVAAIAHAAARGEARGEDGEPWLTILRVVLGDACGFYRAVPDDAT